MLRHATALTALVAASAVGARAQSPFAVRFNSLTSSDPAGILYVDNCYVESGFRFMAVGDPCGMPASLATYTSADPAGYTGSGALFSTFQESILFMPTMPGTFSVTSIGLAPILLGKFDVNPVTVLFTGMLGMGGSVMQTITIPTGRTGITNYMLSGFTNVSSVRLTVTSPTFEPYVQIDDIVGTVTATPEPATLALVGLGLAGLGAVTRRRRAAAPERSAA